MSQVSRSELEKLLSPQLTPQILYCLENSHQIIPMGYTRNISVLNVNTSSPCVDSEQRCDRVTLSLPLCQSFVTWELIFDYTQLEMPPDFTFGDDFLPDISDLKQLEIYSLSIPDSLLSLLKELFRLYREFNYSKAVKHDRMGLELNMMKAAGITQFSVLSKEIPSRSGQEGIINKFFYLELPLNVDLKRLPPTLVSSDEELTPPSLLVIFKPPTYTQVQTRLVISHSLERSISKATGSTLSLEPWGGGWGDLIIDYLPRVRDKINQIVGFVSNSYQKRKEFANSLLTNMGSAVVEFDDLQYLRAVFLLEEKGFSFLLHITNQNTFPDKQPVLTLQSIYHFQSIYTPFHKCVTDYPYSPRWSGEELVHRIRIYIKETLDGFRIASLQGGKLRA